MPITRSGTTSIRKSHVLDEEFSHPIFREVESLIKAQTDHFNGSAVFSSASIMPLAANFFGFSSFTCATLLSPLVDRFKTKEKEFSQGRLRLFSGWDKLDFVPQLLGLVISHISL